MGIFGNDLPAGLRGYVAAQEIADRRGSNALNQGLGILNMGQILRQQALEDQMNPLKLQMLQSQVANANAPQFERIDLGGSIGLMDKRTGSILGQLPKTATPDAMLGDTRARDMHATPSGSALLGAQTTLQTHATPSGGALLSDQTQRLLHGTPSGSSLLSAQVSREGQNKPVYDAERGIVVAPTSGAAAPVMLNGAPIGAKPKDAPEALLKASGYADRMTKAEGILQNNAASATPGFTESIVGKLPLLGNVAANVSRPAPRQQYQQASEDWVRAKLRQESGAVIADEEMAREIRTYFPQIGDRPEVIAQKAQARQTAIDAMRTAAGRAAPAAASPASSAWDGNERRTSQAGTTTIDFTSWGKR